MRIKWLIILLCLALLGGCALLGLEEDETSSDTTASSTPTDTAPTPTDTAYSVSGYVQKGPYVQGTEIMIRELSASLVPTGRTFTGTIDDNTGSFRTTANVSSPCGTLRKRIPFQRSQWSTLDGTVISAGSR